MYRSTLQNLRAVAYHFSMSNRKIRHLTLSFAIPIVSIVLLWGLTALVIYANGPTIGLDQTPTWFAPFSSNTWAHVWGDIDGDGDLDLIAATDFPYSQIYINENGRISTSPINLNTGASTGENAMALGDVDGDGDLDLAVGSSGVNQVFLNDGQGGFSPGWESSGDENVTYSLAWGDMDGDGDLDLAVGNWLSEDYDAYDLVYRNESAGNQITMTLVWTSPTELPTRGLAWGDTNGDGDLDLVIAGDFNTHIFLNDTNGGLENSPAWENARAFDVSLGDMNRDGYPDLALSGDSSKVFRNETITGALNFTQVWTGTPSWVVDWGDANGDRYLDLAVGVYNPIFSGTNKIYLNENGTLQATPAWEDPFVRDTFDVVWADIDGDSDLDLSVAVYAGLDIVYANRGGTFPEAPAEAFPFTFSPASPQTTSAQSLAWGDVDGDGDLDLAVGYATHAGSDPNQLLYFGWGDAPNNVYLNTNGQLQATPAWTSSANSPTLSLAWGDVDGDGDLDLATGNLSAPDRVYRNESVQGRIILTEMWSSGTDNRTTQLAWGDVDGDGDLDIAAGGCDRPHLYLNQLNQQEQDLVSVSLPTDADDCASGSHLEWGDLDEDGDLDLVIATQNRIRIFNNTVGHLSQGQTDISEVGTRSVALGDVDADGDLDLAIGIWSGQKKIFENIDGYIQPVPMWLSDETDLNTSLAWGDADGDGDLDLASGNVTLFSGGASNKINFNENGGLDTSAAWVSEKILNTHSLAWGDVNQDGVLDLVTGNQDAPLQLYLNQRPPHPLSSGQSAAAVIDLESTPANFYATSGIRDSGLIPFTFTLSHPAEVPFRQVEGFYSPNGGGQWFPAINADTLTNTITNGLMLGEPLRYTWDVLDSGFFGQSDNVVFRLEATPSYIPGPNRVANTYQQASVSAQTFPFRVRGTQVQVFSETLDSPAEGALVYRLPAGQTNGGLPLLDGGGTAYRTDAAGYLRGRGTVGLDDSLFCLAAGV